MVYEVAGGRMCISDRVTNKFLPSTMTPWQTEVKWDFACFGKLSPTGLFELQPQTWHEKGFPHRIFLHAKYFILDGAISLREYKPYISNGVQSEFCESFLTMKTLEPTVVKAFDFSIRRQNTTEDDGESMISALWFSFNNHLFHTIRKTLEVTLFIWKMV